MEPGSAEMSIRINEDCGMRVDKRRDGTGPRKCLIGSGFIQDRLRDMDDAKKLRKQIQKAASRQSNQRPRIRNDERALHRRDLSVASSSSSSAGS